VRQKKLKKVKIESDPVEERYKKTAHSVRQKKLKKVKIKNKNNKKPAVRGATLE
jgi:hypothetical protein